MFKDLQMEDQNLEVNWEPLSEIISADQGIRVSGYQGIRISGDQDINQLIQSGLNRTIPAADAPPGRTGCRHLLRVECP